MKAKIVNHPEMRTWIEEGRPYDWIVGQYADRYGVTLTVAAVASYRFRHQLTRRQVRDRDLIPWQVEKDHRNVYLLEMLRLEARVRAGAPLSDREKQRHQEFRTNLAIARAVVHYVPDSVDGFQYVPRLAQDDDIIRRPTTR